MKYFVISNNNIVKLAIFKIASLTIYKDKEIKTQLISNTSYRVITIKEKF